MLFWIISILGTIAIIFLPFWGSIVPIALIAAFFIQKKSRLAFLHGFFAGALLWLIFPLIYSLPNQHLLANRVATMFNLNNWILLIMITSLLGGILSGLSSMSGTLLRKVLKR